MKTFDKAPVIFITSVIAYANVQASLNFPCIHFFVVSDFALHYFDSLEGFSSLRSFLVNLSVRIYETIIASSGKHFPVSQPKSSLSTISCLSVKIWDNQCSRQDQGLTTLSAPFLFCL